MLANALFALALTQAGGSGTTPGQITIIGEKGPAAVMPLERTSVRAEVAGMAARVTLVQTFSNPSTTPIEAIYTFPMAEDAAVDRMRIRIGDRIIEGEIKRREEARRIYEAAKAAGQTASLLDQERPNIFTQSLANIMPGAKIEVEISYVELVDYKDGQFEFSFPMVVGPRFVPPGVSDPATINPVLTPPDTRSGAGIDLSLSIASDSPLETVESVLHAVRVDRQTNGATVTLSRRDEIPNRDFICRWRPAGEGVQTGFYAQSDPVGGGGTFCLVFMPPKVPQPSMVRPKEVIFVMDQSGSQNGFPLAKSKELANLMIRNLNEEDTFNVISFSNQAKALWNSPQNARFAQLREAFEFIEGLEANGGTMLLPAVKLAYKDEPESGRLRIIVFNTDGFVGNEKEVLAEIQRQRSRARMFTFGIGNGVNRFLIDAMSVEGRGDAEIVTLADSADAAVGRFLARMKNPVLTDISVKVEGAHGLTPEFAPDVFGSEPVIVFGRYDRPGKAKLTLSGKLGGEAWSKTMNVDVPARSTNSPVLPVLWARRKVDDLSRQAFGADAKLAEQIKEEIAQLALRFGIMSSETSFVAVEKRVVNIGGQQRTVAVPVDLTDGVNYPAAADGAYARSAPASVKAGGGGGASGFSSDVALKEAKAATKISSQLKGKTGNLELMIRVKDLTPGLIKKLEKLGLKVHGEDKGLKVIFGSADASKLEELAEVDEIVAIDALG